jgi:cardiolipin synthase
MPLRSRVKSLFGGRKWPVVVLICFTVAGALVFLAQDPRTLDIESALPIEDPGFPEYVAALVNAPMTQGQYTALQNGDAIYPAMLDAIRGARNRIDFETYNYNAGTAADTFTQAFVDAARRGVVVRLVLDYFGASSPPSGLRDRLTQAGVHLVWFNPVGIWTVEATNYRTHRKLLIVDGAVAFTGGAGVADHWLGNADARDHWRDTQFRITGPAVRALEACFYENWVEAGGHEAPVLDLTQQPDPDHARSLVIWSNPTGGVSNVKLLYLYSIAAARRTIDIQSPYFVLDSSVRLALDRARARGVRIRILTDGEVTDAKSVKHASRNEYAPLLDGGDQIFEFIPTMMHVKLTVIDGQWSIFGSANFDNRSFELNDEITLAVASAALAAGLTADFDRDLTRSRAWTAADWHRRPWHWKLREKMWGLLGEVF